MTHWTKEKVYHYMNVVTWYLTHVRVKNPVSVQHHEQLLQLPGGQYSNPQLRQQRELRPQFNSSSPSLTVTPVGSPQLSAQQCLLNAQANMIDSLHNSSLTGSETRNASGLQYGLERSQQCNLSRPHQTSLITSPSGSQIGLEQRTVSPLQHCSMTTVHQNTGSMPKRTMVNALDPTMNSLPSSSIINPFQPNMQQQKHKMAQTQKLKQPIQPQLIEQNRLSLMQKMNEVNEPKVGQAIGVGNRMLQAEQLLLPSTPSQLPAASPQPSHNSSPRVDLKNAFLPFSKAGTPSQSTTSPFIVPSPSTPLTSSSILVDSQKNTSSIYPLPIAEDTKQPQAVPAKQTAIQNQSIATSTPGILSSPLPTDFTSLEGNQQSHAQGQPFKRLLEVVKSISHNALSASVQDIGAVVTLIDRRAGTSPFGESRNGVSQDLAEDIRYQLQSGDDFSLQYATVSEERMNRHISVLALDALSSPFGENNSFEHIRGQVPEMESTATSQIKRSKMEPNIVLLQEIKAINMQLVETVLDVVLDCTKDAAKAGEGTIVRCSYKALGLSEDFKLHCALSQMVGL
ncbi:unnamed protein product [Ilex paraguariensis]|uniref:Uncharacterized protein n=1 Tax=Ilex paraguariensis TaxID=185542 RepID=A0ABC8V5N5_9AQUA